MKQLILFFTMMLFCYGETLDELISKAHQNNPELQMIKERIDSRMEDVSLSGKYDNPMLSVGVNDISMSEPQKRELEPMQTQSVVFSQKLPLSDRLEISKKIAMENLSIWELNLIKKKTELTYKIKKSVYRIKKLENDLKIIKRYEKTLEEIINIHTLYNTEPVSHYQSTLKSTILKTKLELKKTKTKNEIEIEKSALEELINEKTGAIEADFSLKDAPSLNDLISKTNSNIDILIKQKELSAAELGIEHSKSLKLQDITMSAGYFQRDAFDDYLSVSVTFPLNIYEREEIAVIKSLKERDSKGSELEALKNKTENDITAAYYRIKNAREEYELLNSIIASQQEIITTLLEKSVSQNLLKEGYEVLKDILDVEFDKNEKIFNINLGIANTQMLAGETR